MDDFTDSIFEILTSQTGIYRGCRFIPKYFLKGAGNCRPTLTPPHPLPHFPLKVLTQEVKKYSPPPPRLEKKIPEVRLKSLYPPPEGEYGRFYRFDIRPKYFLKEAGNCRPTLTPPHPLPHFPLKVLTQEVKKYSPPPPA